ncbi:MAG TPA: hypothetical protein VHC22_32460 [Pirellulales bacterium]|nr:hypothetical protein [Pirellulales bacterium]
MADGPSDFVFGDEGPAAPPPGQTGRESSAPPDAAPGAALRNRSAAAKGDESAPAPRSAATSSAAPRAEKERPAHEAAEDGDERHAPADRTGATRPRSRQTVGENAPPRPPDRGAAQRRPRPPRDDRADEAKENLFAKLLGEVVHDLQELPVVGKAIGSFVHIIEPLVIAGNRIRQIQLEAKKRESAGDETEQEPARPAPSQQTVPTTPAETSAGSVVPAPQESEEREQPPVQTPTAPTPPSQPTPTVATQPGASSARPQPNEFARAPAPIVIEQSSPPGTRPEPERRRERPAGIQVASTDESAAASVPVAADFSALDELLDRMRTADQRSGPPAAKPSPASPHPRTVEPAPETAEPGPPVQVFRNSEENHDTAVPIRSPGESRPTEPIEVVANRPEPRETETPQAPAHAPEREPRAPAAATANGFRAAPQPSPQAALERLIAVLGPLPEETRALTQTLEPLTSLGYTLDELLSAVRELERSKEERTPGIEGARPGEEQSAYFTPEENDILDRFEQDHAKRKKHGRSTADDYWSNPAATAPHAPRPAAPPPTAASSPIPAPSAAAPVEAELAEGGVAAAGAAEGGAIAAGASFGPIGAAVGVAFAATIQVATRAISGLAKAAQAADQAWMKTAHQLAPYSGALSVAQARAAALRIVNDVQRAQNIGPQLAEYYSERERLSRALDRIGDIFSKFALDKVTPLLERIVDGVEAVADNGAVIEAALNAAFASQFPILSAMLNALKLANKQRDDAKKKKAADNSLIDIMGIFLGPLRPFDPNGDLRDFGSIPNPVTPKPIVPGPGVPPGAGIGGI